MGSSVEFIREGAIGRVTLNRPDAGNALDRTMAGAMRDVADALRQSTDLRAIVLSGRGSRFCVGGDIVDFQNLMRETRAGIGELIENFHAFIRALRDVGAPVLASVQGAAAGAGLSMTLAADLVVSARSTKFTLAYRRLGTSSDGGASFMLPLKAGRGRAAELALLRDVIGADEAKVFGIVNFLAEDDVLEHETLRLAHALAENAPRASANFKRLLDAPTRAAFDAHLDRERDAFIECAATADFQEGVAAFLEKRAPRFGQV